MRIFAAVSPDASASRTVVPVEILRRLAFGRPQRRIIHPALPVQAVRAAAGNAELADLDERVRASGEW